MLALGLLLAMPRAVAAQTLELLPLGDGGTVVVVTLPMSDGVSLAWPEATGDGQVTIRSTTVPALMGAGELEKVLGSEPENAVPPVVAVSGPMRPDEIAGLVARLGASRPAVSLPRVSAPPLEEGGVERRLAPPGSDAVLRLRLPLPPAADPLRPAAEVLAALIPEALGDAGKALTVRRDGDLIVLSMPVSPELAEVRLDRLRLALARLAEDLGLDAGAVDRARSRLAVRRQVTLAQHPTGAEVVVREWLAGGEAAVRGRLFGLAGVGVHRVEEAARRWLALHPGAAELLLPPRVLNPRFASGPESSSEVGGVSTTFLERPATPLEAVVLRPVLSPDLGGGSTAAVLARLAGALRQLPDAPGWAEVRRNPPQLELAAPAGDSATLLEVLAKGLEQVSADTTPVAAGESAEDRALGLMAGMLGLTSGGPPSPSTLLRPDNLALGALVVDSESFKEALQKLLGVRVGAVSSGVTSEAPAPGRRRAAVPGKEACLVLRLEDGAASADGEAGVLLVEERLGRALDAASIKVLTPLVPGAHPALMVVTAEASLPDLEKTLKDEWASATAPPSEEELTGIRRRLLEHAARRFSGAVGRAAFMAEIAAGVRTWLPPSQWQTGVLAMAAEDVAGKLSHWQSWNDLLTTGAGPLPVSSLPLPGAEAGR